MSTKKGAHPGYEMGLFFGAVRHLFKRYSYQHLFEGDDMSTLNKVIMSTFLEGTHLSTFEKRPIGTFYKVPVVTYC